MNTIKRKKKNTTVTQPDPETLHTTDPQEKMEGPVSSLVQDVKKEIKENNMETKEQADKKKEENI